MAAISDGSAQPGAVLLHPSPVAGDAGAGDEPRLRAAIEAFFFAYREFTAVPDQMLAEQGLGRVHHRILYFVGRHPGGTVSKLLQVLQVSKQALHQPLRELSERGLVCSTPDTHDRRIKRLALTERGQVLERELSETQMRLLRQGFALAGDLAESGWQAVMESLIAAGHPRLAASEQAESTEKAD